MFYLSLTRNLNTFAEFLLSLELEDFSDIGVYIPTVDNMRTSLIPDSQFENMEEEDEG